MRHYDLLRLRASSRSCRFRGLFKDTMVGSKLIITSDRFLYRGGREFHDFSYSRLVFVLRLDSCNGRLHVMRLLVRAAQTIFRHHSWKSDPCARSRLRPER